MRGLIDTGSEAVAAEGERRSGEEAAERSGSGWRRSRRPPPPSRLPPVT